jgi:hypothetical protein
MKQNRLPDAKPVALSVEVYQRLLALYPVGHRQEYGSAMAQLFRDQCRDAWADSRGWGLAILWRRVIYDLLKTSALEHFANLKPRTVMFNQMRLAFRSDPALRARFFTVFAMVWLIVLICGVLLAFLAPEQYASTARLKVEPGANEVSPGGASSRAVADYDPYFLRSQFDGIRSEATLARALRKLDLAESWGKRLSSQVSLSQDQAIQQLRERLELRPVRHTGLIEIRAFSNDPVEASQIANATAASYQELSREPENRSATAGTDKFHSVMIVDVATPGLMPVRPNKPFTVCLGIVGGIPLGVAVGVLGTWVAFVQRRRVTTGPVHVA